MVLLGLALVAVFAATACLGIEMGRPRLVALGKPLATASLFLLLAGAPGSRLTVATALAVALSLVGDVALLSDAETAFLVGLVSFLIAHLCFIVGFSSAGVAGTAFWVGLPVVVLAWGAFLRILWPGLGAMRVPVMIYSAAAASMVAGALYLAGRVAPALGALLVGGASAFFLSDANLGFLRFRRSYPHGQVVTLTLYWLGQIGIVLGVALVARG